jgi:hypothetical protein
VIGNNYLCINILFILNEYVSISTT